MRPPKPFGRAPEVVFAAAILVISFGWAFSLVLDGFASVHNANARYQQNAENDRKKPAVEISEACDDLGINEFRQCIADKLETHYQEQSTNEDLQAQQDMAYWAMLLLGVSAVGVLVSVGGVMLLIATIRQGKLGLEKSTDAVVAAQEANAIMRQEQRPWLQFEFKDFGLRYGTGSDGKIYLLFQPQLAVHNHGKRPAFWVTLDMRILISDSYSIKEIDVLINERATENSMTFAEVVFPERDVVLDKVGTGMSKLGFNISGEDLPAKRASILAMLFYSQDGEMHYTAKFYTCNSLDMLPRPRTERFKPMHMSAFDRYT